MTPDLKVKISRNAKVSMYRFLDYFKGFEDIDIVRRLFGEKTTEVVQSLKVEFIGRKGYMGVSDADGHLIISAEYLKNGDIIDIYLDVIHELTHVRQHLDGKELFDNHFNYVDRPTEIEAYLNAVEEAQRLGLSQERICEYLRTEWMTDDDFSKLANIVGVRCDP